MNRTSTIAISLLSIVTILTIGFNQEEVLNFTQYFERRQIWLEIAVLFHLAVILSFLVYYFIKKDKKSLVTFLICFGLDILVLLVSAIIMAMNFEGIKLKF